MMKALETKRIGVVGTGYIARQLFALLRCMPDLELSRALTRCPLDHCVHVESGVPLTNSLAELVAHSDLVVECSGDPLHAAEVVREAFAAGLPVVTMNSEFHVTCGAYFAGRGYLSEAHGDQPGVLAQLREEVLGMGFRPLVYGNMKGYLNHDPPDEDMRHWSKKLGFRFEQTTSFTDGTKVQVEQAFVANAFGAGIAQPGLLRPSGESLEEAARLLGEAADLRGEAIADMTVGGGQPPGVFIVATHDPSMRDTLRTYKMGDGPYYTFVRPYHLCGVEIPNTIRRALRGEAPLLQSSPTPTIGVAAIAKRAMRPGDRIENGVGSRLVRGSAVRIVEEPNHVPIGLLQRAVVRRSIEPGQVLHLEDVELPESYARDITLRSLRDCSGLHRVPSSVRMRRQA